MNIRALIVFVVASSMLYASESSAQSASPSPASWEFEFVPYLWGSGIKGEVGIGNRTADVDASFSNVLSHLHLALMGLTEVRRDRLVALTDLVYTDLRGHDATPGPLFSSVTPEQKLFFLTSEGGVRLTDTEGGALDVVGGIRFWRLRSELQFGAGVLPGVDMQASRNWVDGIVGVRAKKAITSSWWASGYGDVGAGGSDLTYQLAGTGGWDIDTRYGLLFGYRYLHVDYNSDGVLFDSAIKGPWFGFNIKL